MTLCLVSVLLVAGAAIAQEEDVVRETEEVSTEQEIAQREELSEMGDSATRQIEEITVTARKTQESLDDTPLTIRALTADAVAELGIFDVENVALNTPGIHISNYFGARDDPNIAFRGMDAGTIDRIAQISSSYIDGLYLPGATSWISVGAIERTEVVKGPQSALYGRSAFGGAINFVMKDPTPQWGGDAALTIGENGRFDIGAGVGGSIVDRLSFHTFARGYEYDGGYDNPFPESERMGSQSTKAIEGSLQWDISDSVGMKIRGFYSQDKDGPAAFAWFDESLHNCGPFETDGQSGIISYYCGTLDPDLITDFGYDTKVEYAQGSSWPKPEFGFDRDFFLGGLHLDAQLSDSISLTSITGYIQEETAAMQDFSGTQTLLQYFNYVDELKSQELRVQGTTSRLDWMAGFYYLDADYESKPNGFGCADPSYMFDPVPFPGSGCVLFAGAAVRGAFNLSTTTPHRLVENTALFGSLTWRVSDSVTLIADARAARETLDFGSLTAVDGEVRELKDDFDSFLPRVVFDWKPNSYSTVYASISTGNKPGNFNPEVAAMCESCIGEFEEEYGIGIAVPESEAINYEVGYKLVTANGKHRFNAALFYFDWTNQAFTQAAFGFDTNGDGVVDGDDELQVDYQTVAGESEITGAEFFYSGWVASFLNITASYNYNDAKYVVFEDTTHGRVYGSRDASGKAMPRSPKSSATLGLGFVAPLGNVWEFNARADYVYRGSSYTWAVNLAETGATNRLSLRAGVRDDRWDLSVWMNNVTDDDTLMAIRRFSSLANFVAPTWWGGLPGVQEAGVTVRVRF
jgi:iron complex outermembrane receptor protein